MNIQPMDIVIHVLNILVLYVLLRFLLYKPVRAFMDGRTAAIQASLDSAKKTGDEADQLKANFDERIRQADEEAQRRLLEGTQKASEAAASIVTLAQQQATEIVDKAREKAENERKQMVQSLEPQITEMAIGLASEVLKREVKSDDNQKLIDSFFNKAV